MLPVFRRFTQQDVPNAPNWFSNIFTPLNTFCEQTVQTLNKNLTLGTNVQGQKFSVSFTTAHDYKTQHTFTPITLQYTGGGQPTCCMIGSIVRTDGTLITNAVSINSWFLNINKNPAIVTINYIAGLENSTRYTINVVVL